MRGQGKARGQLGGVRGRPPPIRPSAIGGRRGANPRPIKAHSPPDGTHLGGLRALKFDREARGLGDGANVSEGQRRS